MESEAQLPDDDEIRASIPCFQAAVVVKGYQGDDELWVLCLPVGYGFVPEESSMAVTYRGTKIAGGIALNVEKMAWDHAIGRVKARLARGKEQK